MDTLVLNASYQPVGRVSWQTAFRLIFSGRVEVVDTYTDRIVRSAREVFQVPSIVRFVKMVKKAFRRRGVSLNRKNIYLRDRGRCQFCGTSLPSSSFTLDHLLPRSQGGGTSWENVVVACIPCNQRKRNRTPEQAGMKLLGRPVRPKTLPGMVPTGLVWNEGMPSSWRDYLLSFRYWHAPLDG